MDNNMKKLSYIIALAFIFNYSATVAQESSSNCDATALKSELKAELKPDYKYDSSKITRFTYSADFQGQEIEVPLLNSAVSRAASRNNSLIPSRNPSRSHSRAASPVIQRELLFAN